MSFDEDTRNKEYLYVSTIKSIDDAKEFCQSRKAILYEPKDSIITKKLVDHAKIMNKGFKSFWLGIHDEHSEGNFIYDSTNADVPSNIENWDEGEPNDDANFGSGGEDCVIVQRNGKWNDVSCFRHPSLYRSIVCQKGQ